MLGALLLSSLIAARVLVRVSPPPTSRPVVVATSSWRPYVDQSLPGGGPVAQMLTLALRRAGYEPEYSVTSWPLAQQRVKEGSALAMAPLSLSADRRRDFLVSDSLVDFQYALFCRTDRPVQPRAAGPALSGIRVARVAGYEYWPALDSSGATFVPYPTARAAFDALAAGHVDIVPEDIRAGRELLAGADFAGDAHDFDVVHGSSPVVGFVKGLHVLFSRSAANEALVMKLNSALRDIRSTQDYQDAMRLLDDPREHARLVAPPGRLVELRDESTRVVAVSPVGVEVAVRSWPASSTGDPLVTVKVLGGPLQGRSGQVHLSQLEVSADGDS